VHLATFPSASAILGSNTVAVEDPQQQQEWTTLRSVRDQVLKALEEARNEKQIGKGLEAQIKLTASDALYTVLERHKDELRYVFIVSQVTLERSPSGNGTTPLTVEVTKADGEKCERCWNYSVEVGKDPEYPTVCERCAPVLRELEAKGKT
jgi:isoleucyl-tRNA synthetase